MNGLAALLKAILFTGFLFACLASLSFSDWFYGTGNPIANEPVVFQNGLIVETESGALSFLDQQGNSVWNTMLEKYLNPPSIYQNELVVSSTNCNVFFVKQDGSIRKQILVKTSFFTPKICFGTYDYDRIYVSSDNGLAVIEKNNSVTSLYQINATLTRPFVDNRRIIFGANNKLISIKPTGELIWQTTIGQVWTSNIVVSSNTLYVGSLDGSLYALNVIDGTRLWQFQTNGWITGNALYNNGIVYFGSLDGYLYAVNSIDGKLVWKTKTASPVFAGPVATNFAGRESIIAGSDDGSVYVFDKSTGAIFSKFQARSAISGVLSLNKNIYFASKDGTINQINSIQGCSINQPSDLTTVGFKEVALAGLAVSENQADNVNIFLNGNTLASVPIKNNLWSYYLDPQNLKPGLNTLECSLNPTTQLTSQKLNLKKSTSLSKGEFLVNYPSRVKEGTPINISVIDADDGSMVQNFLVDFNGKKYQSDGNITLSGVPAGKYIVTISKTGFNNKQILIEAGTQSDLVTQILPLILVILAIVLVYQIYKKFIRKS